MVIGLLSGGLSGLFGVGGGILIVPGLTIFGGMNQRLAHGTSLAAIVPLAAGGLLGYAGEGQVDWVVAGLLLLGSMAGAVIGTHLLRSLSQELLRKGFAALLLITAIRLFFDDPAGTGRPELNLAAVLGLVVVGLGAGALAGLMGVGGGIIIVPAQTVLFAVAPALAKGTSLAMIIPTAMVGSVQNLRHGNAHLRTALAVGASGTVAAYLASKVSVGLDPQLSSVLFGLLMVASAIRLLARR